MNHEFNIKLKNILQKNSLKPKFVLGLSGGPDSIAMLYMMKSFFKNNYNPESEMCSVIIDHSIRKESLKESYSVKKISEDLGFRTFIIPIGEEPPKSNLQNWARIHRRNLLINEALRHNSVLLLAHHLDDQIETLFMRLIKGSGFFGLIGMRYVKYWNGVSIIRPFLNFKKKQLLDFVKENKLNYLNDPSNTNINFERVQTRSLLSRMENEISFPVSEYLKKTSILSDRFLTVIDEKLKSWIADNISFYRHGSISANFIEFSKIYVISPNFCNFIFGKLIQKVGGKNFSPKKSKMYNKLNLFFSKKLTKFTLGNVIIYFKLERIVFIREIRNLIIDHYISKKFPFVFDHRFIIISNFDGHIFSSVHLKSKVIDLKGSDLFSLNSNYINKSLPILKTLEGRVIKPYLNIIEEKDILSHIPLKTDFNVFFIKDLGLS